MAVLFPPGFGDIEYPSGAKLYVYLPNTTTNASLYATSSLSGGASLSNPVVANSAGRFAQVFVADGATFDVRVKTSADVAITDASWDDVPGLGETPDSLSRDFGAGGRFQVSGAGGTITLAAGDASPDNSGGDLEVEGWGGTNLDTLAIRSDDITFTPGTVHDEGGPDLTIPGEILQEDGKRSPDLIWSEGSFSAAANFIIALPSGYNALEIEIVELVAATGGQTLTMQFSFDNGATYKSAAADYEWATFAVPSATATNDGGNGTYIPTSVVQNSAIYPTIVKFRLIASSTANVATLVEGSISSSQGSAPSTTFFVGHSLNTYGRATHIRGQMTSGNITGRYRVVAKRGLGGTSA